MSDPTVRNADATARQTIQDALCDSSYLAGVTAGWNAANSDDPEAKLAQLQASRSGHLADFKEAKAILATLESSPADGDAGVEVAHENDAPEARLEMVRVVLEAIAGGEEPRALARAGLDFCNLTQAERETMRGEGAALTPTETGELENVLLAEIKRQDGFIMSIADLADVVLRAAFKAEIARLNGWPS